MTKPIYIIAEMACSHEGDVDLGRKIIDGAGAAGAQAIQFQIWSLEDMVVPQHPDYPMLSRIELSRDTWKTLAAYVRKKYPAMEIIACVYEPGSVDFALTLPVDAFKLHSSDLSNPHLIRHVAATGKRIDLSVGASTIEEMEKAVSWIRETSELEIWMMYGYQNFPTPTDAINLDFMMRLKEKFGLPIGYQDHSGGGTDAAFWLPAAAAGMGVDVLEKHITHDRSFKGVDHEAALNPDEFVRFVAMVREIEAARGKSEPGPFSAEEEKYRKYAKKSLVAAHDAAAGSVLSQDDLAIMRAPELGLPPDQADRIVGKKLARDVRAYEIVREEDVK